MYTNNVFSQKNFDFLCVCVCVRASVREAVGKLWHNLHKWWTLQTLS